MKTMEKSNVPGQSPLRVMVIDDEEPFCRLIRDSLKSSQEIAVVAAFQDPIEAIEAVSRVRPDIVVIDLRMPGMSGIECMERMREAHPEVKFLLVAGMLATLTEDERAVARRAHGFLTKPSTPAQFLGTLKAITCGDLARSPEADAFLFSPVAQISNLPLPEFHWHPALSKRENAVARVLCEHPAELDKHLAGLLGMELPTFRTHLQNIYKKLNAHSRSEAIQKLTTR